MKFLEKFLDWYIGDDADIFEVFAKLCFLLLVMLSIAVFIFYKIRQWI